MRLFVPITTVIIGLGLAAPAMAQIFGTPSSSAYSNGLSSQYSSYSQSSAGGDLFHATANPLGTYSSAASVNNMTGTYGTASSRSSSSYRSASSTGVMAASGSNIGTPTGLPNTGGGGMAHS